MSDPYLGEIRIFAGNFAPVGWFFCNGQTLPISQYDALYNLIGTTYGGDGQTTFNLPNLQCRVPLHTDGGSNYPIGAVAGTESVTLTVGQTPQHSHQWMVSVAAGDQDVGTGNVLAASKDAGTLRFYEGSSDGSNLATGSVTSSGGGSIPHENRQPFLCLNYIIAMEGIYPSQP